MRFGISVASMNDAEHRRGLLYIADQTHLSPTYPGNDSSPTAVRKIGTDSWSWDRKAVTFPWHSIQLSLRKWQWLVAKTLEASSTAGTSHSPLPSITHGYLPLTYLLLHINLFTSTSDMAYQMTAELIQGILKPLIQSDGTASTFACTLDQKEMRAEVRYDLVMREHQSTLYRTYLLVRLTLLAIAGLGLAMFSQWESLRLPQGTPGAHCPRTQVADRVP